MSAVASFLGVAAATRTVAVGAHELAHYLAAWLVGRRAFIRLSCGGLGTSSTTVPGILDASWQQQAFVRHAGWVFSVALAAVVTLVGGMACISESMLWLVAVEAVASDVVAWRPGEAFFCGNFGLMLLDHLASPKVKELLSTMLRVTMMRGAQSAGLITYQGSGSSLHGVRKRVVNGKRTDLCDLLMAKFKGQLAPGAMRAPALFQGHTRFATSSIANLAGCHPHTWTPPRQVTAWRCSQAGVYEKSSVNHECFITHNGDLDFFEWHGTVYPLDDVFALLEAFLGCKAPAPVDSMGVAGLLDLLRAKGIWFAAVRYGYVFGGLATAGHLMGQLPHLWSVATLTSVTAAFEKAWSGVVAAAPQGGGDLELGSTPALQAAMLETMLQMIPSLDLRLPPSVRKTEEAAAAAAEQLVRSAVAAFFQQDLLAAGQQLLANAEGSFGLVLSSAIDSLNEIVVAARGQTMSVAFYPRLGLFTFGSESSATKAGLGKSVPGTADAANEALFGPEFLDGFRFDLDDVNGEVMLLRWGKDSTGQELDASKHKLKGELEGGKLTKGIDDVPALELTKHALKAKAYMAQVMRFGPDGVGSVRAYTFITGRNGSKLPLFKRVLRLGGNPFVEPLPKLGLKDAVGSDIADIPRIIKKIQDDWNEPSSSLNRLTVFTLFSKIKKRLMQHEDGTHDGSVDLLVTGCEVSLWIGEQFASDLHNAFPLLKIVTLSANKLLSQLGQAFPVPNTGFYFNETSYNFANSNVLMISHSGGTFATLNVSNLLKGFTSSLFVVTSEWDTQIARSVRAGKPGGQGNKFSLNSYVFTTFCGCRPAEPVSLTAVATHQLLTQVLFYLMYAIRYHMPQHPSLGGSTFAIQEVQELEGLNIDSVAVIESLTQGNGQSRKELLKQGRYWAQHILEGPIVWILCMLYIAATVTYGATPLSAIVGAVVGAVDDGSTSAPCDVMLPEGDLALAILVANLSLTCAATADQSPVHKHVVGFVDAAIYTFLPIWMTILLRLIQKRPWLHRQGGRSLLIGDCPWVSQTLEAFVSKTFALSYSIATIAVSSGNPLDHLVHRHTHRVVRGALLAVGRPDGRLNALTSAENTICLSVNQASSIQNYGVTCESITVGHNPFKLGLTANAIFIPTMRRLFMSEYILESEQASRGVKTTGLSASALMSILSTAKMDLFEGLMPPTRNGERADFIRRIEPLWGKGSLYEERFIGAWMASDEQYKAATPAELMEKQGQLQEIYEGRIASLQRLISFMVMFHAMAKSVQDFWPKVSFGMLGYDMSRSQSIMRIATTASPVSGSDVRHKMLELAEETAMKFCASILQKNYFAKRARTDLEERIAKFRDMTENAELSEAYEAERREMREAMLVVPKSADNSPDGKRLRAPSMRGKRGGLLDGEEELKPSAKSTPPLRAGSTSGRTAAADDSSGELGAAGADAAPALNDSEELSA